MLNKLLKGCMPWMDKGRWYQVRIQIDENNNVSVFHDNIFSRHEVETYDVPVVKLYFADPSPKKSIVDIKHIIQPDLSNYVMMPEDINISIEGEGSNTSIQIVPTTVMTGTIDVWFFMR